MSTFTRRTLVPAAVAGGFGVLANSYEPSCPDGEDSGNLGKKRS